MTLSEMQSEHTLLSYLKFHLDGNLIDVHSNDICQLIAVKMGRYNRIAVDLLDNDVLHNWYNVSTFLSKFKLILRPVSSMTLNELKEIFETAPDKPLTGEADLSRTRALLSQKTYMFTPIQFKRLFEHDFDVFGLIEMNIAIDVAKLPKQKYTTNKSAK